MYIIVFILGAMFGGTFGVCIMCLMQINRLNDENTRNLDNRKQDIVQNRNLRNQKRKCCHYYKHLGRPWETIKHREYPFDDYPTDLDDLAADLVSSLDY